MLRLGLTRAKFVTTNVTTTKVFMKSVFTAKVITTSATTRVTTTDVSKLGFLRMWLVGAALTMNRFRVRLD
eukprot:1378794-Amorphochlora_amoeboformis.AAC.1